MWSGASLCAQDHSPVGDAGLWQAVKGESLRALCMGDGGFVAFVGVGWRAAGGLVWAGSRGWVLLGARPGHPV
jgi:hypothetical protein